MSNTAINDYLVTSLNKGVRIIQFNRPTRKNAISGEMYLEITRILNEDATNDAVIVTIFTGVGDYYSSGNDLSGSTVTDPDMQYEELVDQRVRVVETFLTAFIDYPKLLIAVVNGPAIGVAVTTLGLCDIVYASDRASFKTPFVDLGFCPEGCSSYLFPRIMGRSKASEMLILGHTMTAKEAYQFGLVSQIIPHNDLGKLFQSLQKYGKLPLNAMRNAKKLINANMKSILQETNKMECDQLRECLCSEEFFEALAKFSSRKSKL